MLRVLGGAGSDCTGTTRRSFLQAGVLGVGGLGLADLYRLKAAQSSVSRGSETSVILFWMSGGPGHMETWDPKPDAVSQFRGPFGATKTTVPGVQFSELLPEHAEDRELVRDAAYLGRGCNPFVTESDPNTPEYRVRNLARPADMPIGRLEDRQSLREALDNATRMAEATADHLDPHMQRAFSLLTSKAAASAFDISAEPDKLRDRYGRHTFGQSALLARRLIEAGVTFVTVNCVPWDHHGTANRLATEPGAKLLIPPFDRALAALVRDLIDRGLYERTLVVAMGEFGRTPKMNPEGGRDHWGNVFSVLMGCGSMKMGQVIGKSTARGEQVADRPVSPQDVTATVFKHLGIDARETHFPDAQNRPTALVETGSPVHELWG